MAHILAVFLTVKKPGGLGVLRPPSASPPRALLARGAGTGDGGRGVARTRVRGRRRAAPPSPFPGGASGGRGAGCARLIAAVTSVLRTWLAHAGPLRVFPSHCRGEGRPAGLAPLGPGRAGPGRARKVDQPAGRPGSTLAKEVAGRPAGRTLLGFLIGGLFGRFES